MTVKKDSRWFDICEPMQAVPDVQNNVPFPRRVSRCFRMVSRAHQDVVRTNKNLENAKKYHQYNVLLLQVFINAVVV